MNPLRTITRASNWTPDGLRVLSALVLAEDRVYDEPLGRVEGVVLDDRDEIQSFIVRLWEHGRAAHAVLVPLEVVRWYTEGHTPALGIAWSAEMVRRQPAIGGAASRHRPSLTLPGRRPGAEPAAPPVAVPSLTVVLLGALVGATLGSLLQGPVLAVTLGLLSAVVASTVQTRRRIEPPAPREPWIALLERHLASPRAFERRILHFSRLHPPAPPREATRAA